MFRRVPCGSTVLRPSLHAHPPVVPLFLHETRLILEFVLGGIVQKG